MNFQKQILCVFNNFPKQKHNFFYLIKLSPYLVHLCKYIPNYQHFTKGIVRRFINSQDVKKVFCLFIKKIYFCI